MYVLRIARVYWFVSLRRKRAEGKVMYRRILVPLDGSPLAEGVLPHVQELARSIGAEVVLLRVAFAR